MADPYGYDRPTLVDLTDNVNTFRRKVNQISDDLGDKRRLLTDAGTSLASDSDIVGNLIELDYRLNQTNDDLYLRADGGSLYIQNGTTSTIAAEFLYDSAAGNLSLITPMSGDFTIDTVGDIILDADGNDIRFKNGGGGDEVVHTLANDANYTITAPNDYIVDAVGDIDLDAGDLIIRFKENGTTHLTHTLGPTNFINSAQSLVRNVDGALTDSADTSILRVSGTTTTDTVGTDYVLTAGGNYTVDVDGSIADSAGTTISRTAGTNITDTATTGSYSLTTGTTITQTSGGNFTTNVTGDIDIDASGNYTLDIVGSIADSAATISRVATTTINDTSGTTTTQTVGTNYALTAGGNYTVDVDGSITDSAGTSIFRTSGTTTTDTVGSDYALTAGGNYTVDVDGSITDSAGTSITHISGTSTTHTVGTDYTLTVGGTSSISSVGDYTLDVEGDIIFDAADSDIFFQRAGTTFGQFQMGAQGNVNTLEMDVPQGDLYFDVTGDIILDADGTNVTIKDAGTTQFNFISGTDKEIDVPSGNLTVDVAGDLNLDAAGQQINFLDATNTRMVFNLDATPQLDVTGNYTVTGSGSILQSSTTTQELTGTDITLDASNNIYLEADGDQIHLRAITADKFIFGVGTSPTLGITGNYTETGSGFLYTKAGSYLKDSAATTSTLTANSAITRTSVNSSITDVAKTNISQTATTGSYSQSSGTTFTQTSGTTFTQTSGGNFTTDVTGNIDIDASGNYTLDVVGSIRDSAATYTTISGGATSRTSGTTTTDTVGTEYTLTAGNKVSITGDSVDIVSGSAFTLTSVGNFTTNVTGEYLVDASGDITLDADGNDIIFKNGAGADTVTHTLTEDGDYTITQSGSGDYTVDVGGDIILDADDGDIFFKDAGTEAYKFTSDGTISRTGDILVDVTGDITLDAAGDNIIFADAGSTRITYTLGATTDIGLAGSLTTTVGGSTTENVTNSIERNAGSTILDSAGSSHTIVAKTNLVQTATDGSYTLTTGTTIAQTSGTTITRTGGLGISDVVSSGNYSLDAQAAIKDSAGTTHTIVAGTAINQTAKTGFIQTVTGGNFTTNVAGNYLVDASGDITLDADGNDIVFKNGAGSDVVTHTLADDANYTITVPGDYTVDAVGDITLDADGNNIRFDDGATTRVRYDLGATNVENWTGNLTRNVSGSILDSAGTTLTHVAGTNIVQTASTGSYALTTGTTIAQTSGTTFTQTSVTTFTQTSGGNFTTNVTGEYLVDASGDITLDADGNDIIFKNGAGADTVTHTLTDAGAYTITQSGTGDYKIDVGGDIILDANGGDIRLFDDTVEFGAFSNSLTNLVISSTVNNSDIVFKGYDNSVLITALTLDMSDSGSAIFSHDIYLPDNGKAIFGAGSDLQIYHDETNSYVSDVGTGSLILRGTNLFLQNGDGSQDYITCSNGSAVNIKHAGSTKLTTTATGVDVTGTVTADGLQVTNIATTGTNQEVASFRTASGGGLVIRSSDLSAANPDSIIEPFFDERLKVKTNGNDRLLISNNGDISFYEDTGTDAKLFWDASAESLGIGTSTVHADLHLGAASPHIDIGPSAGNRGKVGFDSNNVYIGSTSSTGEIHFRNNIGSTDAPHTSGDTKMVITDSGVGINTTPKAWTAFAPVLQIKNASTGGGGALAGTSADNFRMFANTYYDGSYKRLATGFATQYAQESGAHVWSYAASGATDSIFTWSEAMRIDPNGNLLVGTTDINPSQNAVEGIALSAGTYGGYFSAARSGGVVAQLARLTNDGDILNFRDSADSIGSIGTNGGLLYLTGTSSGLKISSGNIRPVNGSGANLDNSVDLGKSDTRFKDLYLSGTAYLPSVDIDGGSIVGCTEVGSAASPISSGEFNTLTVNTNLSVPGTISPNGIIFNDASALGNGRYDQSMTWGNDSDLAIYHDGSNSYISDKGTGDLRLTTNVFRVRNAANTQTQILAVEGGAVTLFHSDASKLVTTSTGVTVTGLLTADTKSFTIDHPTKEGMKLRYGSLEGPEHGVYVRGRLNGENTIELPEVWLGLVDADTITVNLTPIGKGECWVEDIQNNTVTVGGHLNCFYMVLAERKDVEKLKVEFPADGS